MKSKALEEDIKLNWMRNIFLLFVVGLAAVTFVSKWSSLPLFLLGTVILLAFIPFFSFNMLTRKSGYLFRKDGINVIYLIIIFLVVWAIIQYLYGD